MKQAIWSKTLLTSYSYLEKITDAIDEMVINHSSHSGYDSLDTIMSINRVIELTDRKKLLINTKILVENVLAKLSSLDARILVLKYFDKVKTERSAEVLGLSNRTYFRRSKTAIENFSNALLKLNYSEDYLNKLYKKELWILDILKNVQEKENTKQENENSTINDYKLFSLVFNNLAKKRAYSNAL